MSTRSAVDGSGQVDAAGQDALLSRRRFSVDEYYAMVPAGILVEDERVELLDGEIVVKPRISPPHASCVTRLHYTFFRRLDDGAVVWVHNPVRLDGYSVPEPDVTLLKRPLERYVALPTPEDVLLIVEVADDTSLDRDRAVKLPLYASAEIAEAWIVNVKEREIEVYRQPSGDRYTEVRHLREGTVTPVAFPDEAIDIEEILGPAPSASPA